MNLSFRSAPAILRAVDAVFAVDAARAGVSSVPVKHEAFKPFGGKEKIGHVEVWPLIPAPIKAKDEETWQLPLESVESDDPEATLADHIADQIKNWLREGTILPAANRPIAAGDIMILLRRRRRFADLMVRALKKRDVPVMGVDRMRLVQQLPVMDLLALMQFALLPEDDLTLATVLRAPLLNLSEDELMTLAIGRGRITLWQSLVAKRADNPRFKVAHEYLLGVLNSADFTTPFAFLARALSSPCPGSSTSGRHALWQRLGPDALDPVQELLGAAQDFSHRHAPSLQNFLHWLTMADSEIKREMDKGDDKNGGQVRIMTVHASKGLEAPIVFLPDCGGVPRTTSVPVLQWTDDCVPLYLSRQPKMGVARRVWQSARDAQMEEYRRLLYVALTRPINRLYIAGVEPSKNSGGREESWHYLASSALRPIHEPHLLSDAATNIIALADPWLPDGKTKPASAKTETARIIPLPAWATMPVPEEKAAPRSIAPSHLDDYEVDEDTPATATPDATFHRGRIIHRLLQSLPDVADAEREKVAQRFLASPHHALSPASQKEIAGEVLKLLRDPQFAPLWGVESRAEAALVGVMDGRPVSGQVDRLCLVNDEVWVVDYKTNRPPPDDVADVPRAYTRQMAAYAHVLKDIYPQKRIRTFLLWTYRTRLMEVGM